MSPPVTPGGLGSPPAGNVPGNGSIQLKAPGAKPSPLDAYRLAPITVTGGGDFRTPPTLDLRTDIRNPIRSNSRREIRTVGDVREAIEIDFVSKQLRKGGKGAQVIQRLGSFPGYRHPELPLNEWNPDQKPDLNIIGEAEVILRQLQPMMGWNEATYQANLALAKKGMVYFNQAIETPVGPIPFKMGILDTAVWEKGIPYFEIRASLLPVEDTYRFLGDAISREQFVERHRQVEADWMGRTLVTFTDERFSADEFVQRRYRHNFQYYERYRFWEGGKGAVQLEKYRHTAQGDIVAKILVPGFVRWLNQHPGLLEVADPSSGILEPSQVTPENFERLEFRWTNSAADRQAAYREHLAERSRINSENWAQSKANMASNKTSRRSFHGVSKASYMTRKLGRKLGIGSEPHPRLYAPEASYFLGTETIGPALQRLGATENPIDQMIILAGYPPEDEHDPEVWKKIVNYGEAEISRGRKPNILIPGNNPSKFTFMVRGVPAIAYRFMDGLRAPGVQNIVVVGPPDVGATLEAFQSYFAREIQARGKRFIYVNTGLGKGSFTQNLKQGLDVLPNPDGIAILAYGDTPRVDLHNVAHHPWRHNLDYIFGANGRDMVLDFMGMNAHYQADLDRVAYASKEGNVQAVRSQFPMQFWQKIFENRKSVLSGPLGKVVIALRYLSVRPLNWRFKTALGNMAAIVWDLSSPRLGILDVAHIIADDIIPRSVRNVIHRLGSGKSARPPWVAMKIELVEDVFRTQMKWNADFRATHLDPGGLIDIDGVRDFVIAELMGQLHPHPHQADLQQFAREGLFGYRDRIPALENTPERINQMYLRLREELLQREAERPTKKKLGITDETLRRLGFDPDVLPFTEEGEVNPKWVKRAIPQRELESFRRAFEAYANRGNHAEQLGAKFQEVLRATQPYSDAEKVKPKVEKFVLREINAEPERMRGLVLEWDFDRIESAVLDRARLRFGEHAEEVGEVKRYFELSTAGHCDTPLRRVLLGLKSVDVIRRYQSHLSPAEYQTLYPNLVELIGEAQAASPPHQTWRKGPIPHLWQFFGMAQETADQVYVRKIGESPPPYRSREIGKRLPHSNSSDPFVADSKGNVLTVDGPVLLPSDVKLLSRRLRVLPSRVPHLMAAASGANSREALPTIPHQRMSFERLLAWTQSETGQAFMKGNGRHYEDSFRNRAIESGPGLLVGLGALFAGTKAAEYIGLDPVKNPHEHFMAVVGAGHLANTGFNSVWEVVLNRRMGSPFNFVTTRMVSAGGEGALQYSFQARNSLSRALADSAIRNYGLQGGLMRRGMSAGKGLVTLPIRASWNMGAGLMASALTDRILSEGILGLDPNSSARKAIHFGSFFLPDIYQIAYGSRGAAIFRSRGFRWASRAFAIGFMADMAFLGVNRLAHGSEGATTQNLIYQRANQLNDADGGSGLVDGAFEMLSPSLSAWWDSVEFNGFGLKHNKYYHQAKRELLRESQRIDLQSRQGIGGTLIHGLNGEALDPSFYSRVDYSFLSGENKVANRSSSGKKLPTDMFYRDLRESRRFSKRFNDLKGHEEQVRFIQKQYRGWSLSREDVETMLSEINRHAMRSDLGAVHHFEMRENRQWRELFDESGTLRSGREKNLLRTVFNDPEMTQEKLLQARKAGLILKIMQLREKGNSSESGELKRLAALAKDIQLIDSKGEFITGQAAEIAQNEFTVWREHRRQNGISVN